MSSKEQFKTLNIHHEPFGEHNPYEHLPWERVPREPASGEEVTLGIETDKAAEVEKVWCEWAVIGEPKRHTTESLKIASGEESDLWEVMLPNFPGGQTVRYRLFARNGTQQVESEEFIYSVSTWVKVKSLIEVKQQKNRLTAIATTELPNLQIEMKFENDQRGAISWRIKTLKEAKQQYRRAKPVKEASAAWDQVTIVLQGDPLHLEIRRRKDGMVLSTSDPLQLLVRVDGTVSKYSLAFKSPTDEAFYGFGERFNAIDQRGNHLLNHIFAQYTGQGNRSYIPIPFFISSRRYGVWLNTSSMAEFDLACDKPNQWSIKGYPENKCADFEMNFFVQDNPKTIIQVFTALTGKPILPPPWAFALWMSSNDWNSQSEVQKQLENATRYQIPAGVIVIEAWSDEINFYIWNDAKYKVKPPSQDYSLQDYSFPKTGHWPEPKMMIEDIHRAGLRLVLWQIPVIKNPDPEEKLDESQKIADEKYGIQEGYVIRSADGSPYRIEGRSAWFPDSLVFDFTNPEAAKWWFRKRQYLLTEMGVDGFKTDGGEHIWNQRTLFHNGMSGRQGINSYPLSYLSAYHQFLADNRGDDSILFSRAGYTGVQQYSCHWVGDEKSTWEAFRASLRAMLNASLSGISFIGWDIAGFAGDIPSAELYLRAVAFSVFCPIMQFHSDMNRQRNPCLDRTPWNIQARTDETDVIPIFRDHANLRMNLIPYILGEAKESSRTGIPLLRALPLEFPDDLLSHKFPYEYLFGDALLVAPVVEEGLSSMKVYLPEGEWRDFWSGAVFEGPQTIEFITPRNQIPVFQRQNSLIPLNLGNEFEIFSPVGNSTEVILNLVVLIFPGDIKSGEIYQGKNHPTLSITVTKDHQSGTVKIELEGMRTAVDLMVAGNKLGHVQMENTLIPEGTWDKDLSTSFWVWESKKQLTRVHIPMQESKIVVTMSDLN